MPDIIIEQAIFFKIKYIIKYIMVLNTKLRLILTTLLLSLFVVSNAITVYYKDTNSWGGVNGHVWNASASSEITSFPGKQWILKCVDGGDTWYKYEYQSTSMNLKLTKFSDSNVGTGDIGPLTTDCWIEGISSTPHIDPITLANLESLTFTTSVAIKFASDALTGWDYSNALSTTTSDNENYSLTYLYSTGSGIDVWYDTTKKKHVSTGEIIGYSASYIGQVVTFVWNTFNETLSVTGFSIVSDVPTPHYLGDIINLTAENGTGPTYTWYKSTDDGATYSVITGETTEMLTVFADRKTNYNCVDDGTSLYAIYDIEPIIKCDPQNTNIEFTEDFGTVAQRDGGKGDGFWDKGRTTSSYVPYTSKAECVPIKNSGEYAVVANAKWCGCSNPSDYLNTCDCDGGYWFRSDNLYGHTQGGLVGGVYGGMLLVNCGDGTANDNDILYEREVTGICVDTYIRFSAFIANAAKESSIDPIKVKFILWNDTKTTKLAEYTETNLSFSAGWKEVSAMFNTGSNDNVIIQVINKAAAGGAGNDLLLDDLTFSTCTPEALLYADYAHLNENATGLCGSSLNLEAVTPEGVFFFLYYLWQKETSEDVWEEITGASGASSTCSVIASDTETKYRAIVANNQTVAESVASGGIVGACGLYVITNSATVTCGYPTVSMSINEQEVCLGDQGIYTMTVSNPLSVDLTNVVWKFAWPHAIHGAEIINISTGSCSAPAYEWTIPFLGAGTTETMTYEATAISSGLAVSSAVAKLYLQQINGGTIYGEITSPSKDEKEIWVSSEVPYTVTGGGSYCAGGEGFNVGLASSQKYTKYQLKRDGVNVGGEVIGDWGAIDFGKQTVAGTYTVTGDNICGVHNMSNDVTITVNELPNISISSAAECDLDVLHYHLEVTVSEGTVTSTAGTVVDEGGNVWSISSVPTGTNITVTVETGASCSEDLAVTAPDCSCPTIAAPDSKGDQSYCSGGTIPTLEVNSVPAGIEVDWYDVSTGGVAVATNTLTYTPLAAGTYYAEAREAVNGCVSDTRTAIAVTVNALPNISISSAAECDLDLLHYHLKVTVSEGTVTSTAGTVVDEGSNVWSISSVPTGTNITVTVTTGASCSDDLAVTAPDCSCPTIVAPVSTGDQSYCAGGTIPTLEVNSVPAGIEVDWYEASTGGVAVATNTLTYTPLAAGTYYAEAREAVSGCTSTTRTAIAVTVNAIPTAVITGDASVCQNGTLQLTGSGATDLSWNGGAYAAVTTYDVTTTASGSQNITLKVRDANLCESAGETFTVTVNALPTAVITGDASVCQNGTLQLTGSGATDLSWNGGAYSTENTFSVNTTTAGVSNITLKVRDTNLCESSEESTSITVNELPNISISSAAEGDLDLLHYHLEVTVSEGTVTSTAGTVVDEGGNVWSISSVPTGTNITVTVETGASCSEDLAVTAPDCSCPTIAAPDSKGDQSYCSGGTIPTLEVNSVPAGIEVDWYDVSTGGVAVATNTLTYTPLAAGTYYAESREAVSGCVSDTRTAIAVTVNELPTAVITGDASVCQNGTLQLTGSGATDLSWNGGAYAAVTTYDVTTTASGSQNITLKVRDANLCESAEETFAVTVNALPTAVITGGASVCQNVSLQLTGSGATYLSWNGGAYAAVTTYDVTTTASGPQNITLKVRDANLCESAGETFTVTVNALPTAVITGDASVCQNGTLQLTGSGATDLSWNGGAYAAVTTYDVTTTASGSQNITLKVRDAN